MEVRIGLTVLVRLTYGSGSETLEASREQFKELIANRNSKVSRILEFKGKVVSVTNVYRRASESHETNYGAIITVYHGDQFYVTLSTKQGAAESATRLSFSLGDAAISFDDPNERLLLKINR